MSIDNNNSSTSAQDIDCHFRNKYEKWYWLMIENLASRENLPNTCEDHHPIPKEVWPKGWKNKDTKWVVGVTFREHFILHLLLVKSGQFSSMSLKRFLENFCRGKNKGSSPSKLTKFWKEFMYKNFVPHNKGKRNLPYVTSKYRAKVGKGGLGKLNNPKLVCKPWGNNKATSVTRELWEIADYLHFHYQFIPRKKGTKGTHRLAKAVGIEPSETLGNIVLAFNGGLKSLCPGGEKWDPLEDEDWRAFANIKI